jgi:hypothetical protein
MLGVLVVPGVVFNNLQNNGLIQQPTAGATPYPMNCTLGQGGTCVLSGNVGCAVIPPPGSSNYCSLSGQTLSFLSACAPLTGLITFNFGALVNSFFSNCGSSQNITPPSQSSTQYAQGTWTINQCTGNQGPPLVVGNAAWADPICFASTPAMVTPNGTMALGGPWGATVSIGGARVIGACLSSSWNGIIGNASAGTVPTATQTCINGYILPAGCTPLTCSPVSNSQCFSGIEVGTTCLNYYTVNSQCLAYGDWGGSISSSSNRVTSFVCTNLSSSGPVNLPGVTNFFNSLNVGSILVFAATIFGAALVIWLSLGLGFTLGGSILGSGASVGFTNNPQGTKLAQTFGFGAFLWLSVWQEFNGWFAGNYLPLGLGGITGIISIVITVVFFIGLYLLSQSGTAASQ